MTPREGRRMRALGADARIRLLTLGVSALAAVVYASALGGAVPLTHQFHLPWWLLAPMFYVAEISLVHLHFRRDNHSFSMSEVPLVLALLYSSPSELIVAHLLGSAI